jgi:hypothetical protein
MVDQIRVTYQITVDKRGEIHGVDSLTGSIYFLFLQFFTTTEITSESEQPGHVGAESQEILQD